MSEKENLLSIEDFNKFLNAIPKISYWRSRFMRMPLNETQLSLLFQIMFYCALTSSEARSLTKLDFDLDKKELFIKPSASSHYDKTTIPPNLITPLKEFLNGIDHNNKLFTLSRATLWKYAKMAGELAGLQLFTARKSTHIEGAHLKLFRDSYQHHMLSKGVNDNLVDLKLRQTTENKYGNYTLEDLKLWEAKHYQALLSERDIASYVEWFRTNHIFYKELAEDVKRILQKILDTRKITYHDIYPREKSIESFREKISKGIDYNPKEMQDLAAVRVICYLKSDVERVCRMIEETFEIDKTRSRDKAKILAKNEMGYQSVHYVARIPKARIDTAEELRRFKEHFFEIQVRTILQHAWAEIQHGKLYKNEKKLPKEKERRFYLVSGILETADNEFNNLQEDIVT